MAVQEKLYTVDEFWEIAHLPENDEKRLELVEGVIYTMPPAGGEHGEGAGNLFGFIWTHVRQHKLGHVTAAETGYVLFVNEADKSTVRAPDVGYISYQRIPDRLPAKFVPMPPDLAVEVVSPNDSAEEVEAKISDYLRAGVRLILVVYPSSKTATVFRGGAISRLNEDEIFDGGDVLPGFSLRIGDVF